MDGGEACDDGNRVACDGCDVLCQRVDDACGDGIAECGEACDDGTPGTSPDDTCQACMVVDPCVSCATAAGNCFGMPALPFHAACFDNTVDQMGKSGMLCAALIACVQDQTSDPPASRPQGSCVDPVGGGIEACYCGYTADDGTTVKNPGACAATGPGFDAPCVPEVQAAAGTGATPETSPLTIAMLFVDAAYAIGDASRFSQCMRLATLRDCSQACGLLP
jgi:hypothetical protein